MDGQKHGKIVRGFSMVDPEMVSKLHTDIKTKGKDEESNSYGYNFREIAHFNFTLPDFSQFRKEFVDFVMKDLVENSTLKVLEESGHLNWWKKGSSLQRLYPLLTSGDGNCLLHAASLGIWGIHDRLLNLRQAVHHTLSSSLAEKTLKRRWLWYRWVKNLQEGLEFNAEEWEAEWKSVLNMADATPRSPRQLLSTVPEGSAVGNEENSTNEALTRKTSNSWQPRYESLEEIHICSLAHALRRPIVVVSDSWVYDYHGNAMSPIPFAGVYLPVECDPSECCRDPLVLAYSSSHFSPVVSSEPSLNQTTESDAGPSTSNEKKTEVSSSINSDSSTSNQVSNTSDVPKSPSTIQAAMSSFYQVTKSTILQAAKSLSPSSLLTTTPSWPTNKPIQAGIPLVDKDFKTLPLPFAADPGPNWDWLDQENSEETIKQKSLSDDEQMTLLKKYLDVVEIEFNAESLFAQSKEVSSNSGGSIGSESEKNQADIVTQSAQVNSSKTCKIPIAALPCDKQPSFYKEVITGYLEKAKERFDFEQETKTVGPRKTESLKCANDDCDLYGTVANNYLCTKCFQLQTKSIVKFQSPDHSPPPYNPPSYSEAVANDQVFYPSSLPGKSSDSSATLKTKTLKEMSVQCRAPGCTFYGTSDKNGFCSKCYGQHKA